MLTGSHSDAQEDIDISAQAIAIRSDLNKNLAALAYLLSRGIKRTRSII
jgi:hypothetical protein